MSELKGDLGEGEGMLCVLLGLVGAKSSCSILDGGGIFLGGDLGLLRHTLYRCWISCGTSLFVN